MSRAIQTIEVSGASINFTGPSGSQIGSVSRVTLVNNNGGT